MKRSCSSCLFATALLMALFGASTQPSPAAASDGLPIPVVRADDSSSRIGTMLVQEQWVQTARHTLISVRGSIRLPAGRWCVRTWASVTPRSAQNRISRVTLEGSEVVRLARITRQKYRQPRINTAIARVTVRANGCAGALYATARFSFHGDG